jgi:hypothetical protein
VTTFAEESLRKSIKLRSELEAKGEMVPEQLQTWYLAEKYQLSCEEITERLRPETK